MIKSSNLVKRHQDTNPYQFLELVVFCVWSVFYPTVLFVQAAEGSPNATVLLSALGDDQRRPCARDDVLPR